MYYGITTLPLGVTVGRVGELEGFMLPDASLPLRERLRELRKSKDARLDILASTIVDDLSAPVLEELSKLFPECKLIANCGVGFNHIDVACARRLGIKVTNTPGVLTDATADLAICLLLMITRNAFEGAKLIDTTGRYGGWRPDFMLGRSVQRKRLGIVGSGEIGRATAARAKAFGMEVVALESRWHEGKVTPAPRDGLVRLSEDEFLRSCDAISIHCKLTPESRGWLNRSRVEKLKRGVFIVNTARGEIIDESALRWGLEQEIIASAGLDVFCNEPVLSEDLRNAPRCLVLPHLGSSTVETRTAMGECVMANITAFARGKALLNEV